MWQTVALQSMFRAWQCVWMWVGVCYFKAKEGGDVEDLIAKAGAHSFIVYPSSSDAKKWPTEKQFSPKSTPTKNPWAATEHVVKPQKKITWHPVNHKESGVFWCENLRLTCWLQRKTRTAFLNSWKLYEHFGSLTARIFSCWHPNLAQYLSRKFTALSWTKFCCQNLCEFPKSLWQTLPNFGAVNHILVQMQLIVNADTN